MSRPKTLNFVRDFVQQVNNARTALLLVTRKYIGLLWTAREHRIKVAV